MEDSIFHFSQKSGDLRVEVTRGHQKKNMPGGGFFYGYAPPWEYTIADFAVMSVGS